jgi:Cu2+-exporting ATPase
VNGDGSLRVELTRTGDRTALAGIVRLVSQAQQSRSRAQALADRAAFYLTIIALASALVTAIVWMSRSAPLAFTIERVVTVLVIACPHALGLAVPLVVAISTAVGAQHGLLVRDRRGLEEARRVKTVVFDKTGTLTRGEHRVIAMRTAGDVAHSNALRLAAAVERDAEHPVARAIVRSAEEHEVRIPPATEFQSIPGHGVQALVDRRRLAVGGPSLLAKLGVALPAPLRAFADEAGARGQGAVFLVEGKHALAAFTVADAVRPEAREAVQRLREMKVEVVMLTGDVRAVAESVARELGIEHLYAQVLPEEKAATIKSLRRRKSAWRWSATASTTHPRSSPPTSAWRSARAPASPWRRATSCSCAATRVTWPASSR